MGVSTEFLVRVSTEFLVGEHGVPGGRDENGDSAWGEHGVNDGVSTEFLVGVSAKSIVWIKTESLVGISTEYSANAVSMESPENGVMVGIQGWVGVPYIGAETSLPVR